MESEETGPAATRRRIIMGLALSAGGAGLLWAGEAFAQAGPQELRRVLPGAQACLLTPQADEGPFYLDPALVRGDIREDRRGVSLRLLLQVVETADCAPLWGARVDVWHADALGLYSGYERQGDDRERSTREATFLRGTQSTDDAGCVAFETIYPGWYRGRTPHVHLKVFLQERAMLTGQLYFPGALSEFIYRNIAPYDGRGLERDTTNASDGVLRDSGGGHESFCSIKEEAGGYLASLVIGVDRQAEAATPKRPPGPPSGFFPPPEGTEP